MLKASAEGGGPRADSQRNYVLHGTLRFELLLCFLLRARGAPLVIWGVVPGGRKDLS